jgi:hypothetical protein
VSDSEISVDTDRLGVSIPEFSELRRHLGSIHGTLYGTLEELDGCWGDDATGRMFGEGVVPGRNQLYTGFRGSDDVLSSAEDGLTSMVHTYVNTEEENKSAVHLAPPEHRA